MGILEERRLTPVEQKAIAQTPRPGVWLYFDGVRMAGDGRQLTQTETDAAILIELQWVHRSDPEAQRQLCELLGVASPLRITVLLPPMMWQKRIRGMHRLTQRGGISTDRLARLYAFRAWQDRDVNWCRLRMDGRHTWSVAEIDGGPVALGASDSSNAPSMVCSTCNAVTPYSPYPPQPGPGAKL